MANIPDRSDVDAVVVGAGFAGLYALHRLRQLGLNVVVVEAGDDVGGTWYWNRYPGARCDVESADYSYSFSPELEQEWVWSERFAAQPELLSYIRHVADRFDLRRDIWFGYRVVAAHFDEASGRWTVELDEGQILRARYCVMATGCLSAPKDVDIDGLADFRGLVLRTARWPADDPDLSASRVGCIGTGSSGIQCIPLLAAWSQHLHVFQRTPNFSVPARNAPVPPEADRSLKSTYRDRRAHARSSFAGVVIEGTGKRAQEVSPQEREREYSARWERGGVQFLGAFVDIRTDVAANDTAAEFIRARIRETVRDPDVAQKLLPSGYPVGTKRLCVDADYFATFNRENVTLVDLRETPIERITPTGVMVDGDHIELDVLVLATGFDAFTGAVSHIDVRGRAGETLAAHWASGPRTYLGLAVSGFPNLFLVTGPGSPSVLANMVVAIEQHVEWITACVEWMDERQVDWIEATAEAEAEWVQHVREVAELTLFPLTASWYSGSNVPGKPGVFVPYVGGLNTYAERCDDIARSEYSGFSVGRLALSGATSEGQSSD